MWCDSLTIYMPQPEHAAMLSPSPEQVMEEAAR